ncbi:MAG: hypothetical protein MRY78_11875 [Saprospiraceae bacterium]|nr:hypothetical protein [Saprospiraceae bacterium]
MNRILIFIIVLSCFSCQSESSTDSTQQQQATPQAVPGSSQAQATPAAEKTKIVKPEVGSIPATKRPVNESGTFMLIPTSATAASGEVACVDVTTKNFNDIISMQFSMQWDPKIATFKGMKNLNLPGLSKNNFGLHILDQGLMTFVWIDNTLSGVSLPDKSPIFQACFTMQGNTGDQSYFRITEQPTRMEALDAEEKLVSFSSQESTLSVQ